MSYCVALALAATAAAPFVSTCAPRSGRVMALLSASLSVRGEESGRVEVARQEGQPVSATIAAAKQQLMALVNAEVAKAEGAAAAAEGDKGARVARRRCGVWR